MNLLTNFAQLALTGENVSVATTRVLASGVLFLESVIEHLEDQLHRGRLEVVNGADAKERLSTLLRDQGDDLEKAEEELISKRLTLEDADKAIAILKGRISELEAEVHAR